MVTIKEDGQQQLDAHKARECRQGAQWYNNLESRYWATDVPVEDKVALNAYLEHDNRLLESIKDAVRAYADFHKQDYLAAAVHAMVESIRDGIGDSIETPYQVLGFVQAAPKEQEDSADACWLADNDFLELDEDRADAGVDTEELYQQAVDAWYARCRYLGASDHEIDQPNRAKSTVAADGSTVRLWIRGEEVVWNVEGYFHERG
jgi:hypothetical protein